MEANDAQTTSVLVLRISGMRVLDAKVHILAGLNLWLWYYCKPLPIRHVRIAMLGHTN